MKKQGLFYKIDALYTKVTKAIIGDIPMDDDSINNHTDTTDIHPTQNKLQALKTFTQKNIEKVKRVGIKQSILTMGEPEEKDVLYKEVIKREKQEEKAVENTKKRAIEKALSKKKDATLKSKKITEKKPVASKVNKEKTSTKKKTVTKKVSVTKTTEKPAKAITKKSVAKKTPIKKKETTKEVAKKKTVATKSTPKKSTDTPTKITKPTTKAAPRGAKKAAKIALYIKDIKKHYGEVDEAFVAVIVKNLGPSIYKRDAELVSCSDPKELDTVRKNFLMKKLGINASQGVLDAAIQDVCEELKSTRTKYRATFYYSLAKKFKKESVLS